MLNVFDLQNRELFEGIQGNILKAHGRHHTANVFIRCDKNKQELAKAWLKSLVVGEDALVGSLYAQLRSNVLWKESKKDTGLFACIHISAVGYDYLFAENTSHLFDDTSFQKGMKMAELNDPKVDEWEAGLRADNHFLLLLAHTNAEFLTAFAIEIERAIIGFARITTIERGDAVLNAEGAGIEHFGYVDGISQPLFFTDEWEKYQADNNIQRPEDIKFNPQAEKELVLVQDPLAPDDPNALGSYFVFRKLEQNVKGFKNAEKDLSIELGLEGEDAERAGAMLVGRFEDGTPVQLNDEAGLIHSAVLNNFDYDPTDAAKCPFHGHIRKTNPRPNTPEGMQEVKKHIMARRGIPFGKRTDEPNDGQLVNKPEGGVGLLFMSYQASIKDQFEFIQKNGANSPHDGLDPVIGQREPRVAGDFAIKWGQSGKFKTVGFDQFVHMKGGEYFFAPSMRFLKTIDSHQIS